MDEQLMKIKLVLEGPLQAWGVPSEYTFRGTSYHPTKKGIIGLIACCMGIPRGDARLESLQSLLNVSYEINADADGTLQSGSILTDFQTVHKADGEKLNSAEGGFCDKDSLILHKAYINDASFTVHIKGPDELMETIYAALEDPVWVPYLGRKSCTPTVPLIPEKETDTQKESECILQN
ncbi:MAG TPA: type I-E CRISPR-associated protein Cas5/CasD [Lachnospiraceae bacterium]|nr:type I-E CRISPR-associated protein Cas5/CasD [Lachnospiraceae bacterium]